jgi:tetratricopeptide (TPR) repeat protein
LGILYSDQGKLAEAEKMHQQALQRKDQKVLGADHISTLNTVNDLSLLYSNQGKLTEAEKMYQQLYEDTRQTNIDPHSTQSAT